MYPDHDPARRALLASMVALLPLPACAQANLLCPDDPTVSNIAAPLTIDAHTHIFNGRDLQIREFLSQTTVGPDSELYPLVQTMAGMLQTLGWHLAPDASAERAALGQYAANLDACRGEDSMRLLANASYEAGYAVGRAQLKGAAARRTPQGAAVLGRTDSEAALNAVIEDLPPTYQAFEQQRGDKASVLGSQPTFLGYIQFVLHHFNHRHVNAIDYLTTYSKGSSRKVDLMVSSMVDYDWWLTKGRATPTTLTEQVELMRRISVLMAGRMHGFVPFCPFRETMTLDTSGQGDGMRLVRRAIETEGFIGVKLYPPMGFAPWGNTDKTVWQGKSTLHPAAADPQFGRRLDAAMLSLFTYCRDNDVPVMAHTNHSNGPYEKFKDLAGSEYWKLALERFPGLRVSFGHFGDTDLEDHRGERTLPFMQLMTREAGTPGVNAFADSGYFAGALINQIKLRNVLRELYGAESRIMQERLMYGSDWQMILPQAKVERYLSEFIEVMHRIEDAEPGLSVRKGRLADAFFGRNATEFLGLRPNRGNRRRLEKFYERNDMPTPEWMRKVDAMGS